MNRTKEQSKKHVESKKKPIDEPKVYNLGFHRNHVIAVPTNPIDLKSETNCEVECIVINICNPGISIKYFRKESLIPVDLSGIVKTLATNKDAIELIDRYIRGFNIAKSFMNDMEDVVTNELSIMFGVPETQVMKRLEKTPILKNLIEESGLLKMLKNDVDISEEEVMSAYNEFGIDLDDIPSYMQFGTNRMIKELIKSRKTIGVKNVNRRN